MPVAPSSRRGSPANGHRSPTRWPGADSTTCPSGHTRPELVRAVLEGVAFNSRWLYEAVERFVGRRLPVVRMLGGGATSALWCRIHADVLDRTVEQVADPVYANLRGAALLAGLALGDLTPDEVRACVPVAGTFRPDPTTRAVYDDRFAEFPRLYRAQRGIFHRLNKGTA